MISHFKTGFNGCSVKFSPFLENRLAVATAQNFGIIGNGRLHILDQTPQGHIAQVAAYDTLDGLYDVAFSECNENIIAAACGDGSVKIYDMALPPAAQPVRAFKEHRQECSSISWNSNRRDQFLTSSWDDTVKLWSLDHNASLRTFPGHTYCVYQAAWNPQQPDVFMSASGDMTVRIWDTKQPAPSLVIPAHGAEILTADWCKYNDCLIATGSVDKSIKIWDVRMPQKELKTLVGHTYVVRKVAFSPHREPLLLSCSYDMTVKLWDVHSGQCMPINSWGRHTEFALGIDFSVLREGRVASTGWDENVFVWDL
uniref:Peroxin-7 n=1 Tax=Polytomella parva TaxID=51329 RepID=A0A7S0V849_9CHLO|mmetsp:Transcript_32766/g.59375  ORF Transcript_32766/g.59375 Transcript_32766/m.59375 type:complete len:312 (+) Transcript_32766:26-961(+)|eukprot:CAMPEP_0175065602 /NCGR_PEP_ID=MMETSP0052_2-20121109/16024_1 /TAXON_ID=51329 ORGANISM="Polytomella parva, Strain SAG 63-3" /NCGR_SAMPLE_ID=MMETSP0052_2 /ASSEMBLY_ACC=CAM_ASM_000194 /LENGTH=311 /DNA_ID=CAMNT_0016332171 /DNA_START=16 /DNA_END=951 /DNA_ORIENTATION=+